MRYLIIMAKYNPETVKQVISFIEDGLSQKDACRLTKIGESTFYDWLKQKPEFSESVELAITKYKMKLLSYVNSQSISDGKLALEVLARRWPIEFGRKDIAPIPKEEPIASILDKDTIQALADVYDEMKEIAKMKINQNKSDKV